MRSMSRSTFDSIIDDFIEDDWEKKSAFGVSLTVVSIMTIFLTLLGVALSVSLGVQHGNQSKKLAFILCSKAKSMSIISRILYSHFSFLTGHTLMPTPTSLTHGPGVMRESSAWLSSCPSNVLALTATSSQTLSNLCGLTLANMDLLSANIDY